MSVMVTVTQSGPCWANAVEPGEADELPSVTARQKMSAAKSSDVRVNVFDVIVVLLL
jgi:hypothetical protein